MQSVDSKPREINLSSLLPRSFDGVGQGGGDSQKRHLHHGNSNPSIWPRRQLHPTVSCQRRATRSPQGQSRPSNSSRDPRSSKEIFWGGSQRHFWGYPQGLRTQAGDCFGRAVGLRTQTRRFRTCAAVACFGRLSSACHVCSERPGPSRGRPACVCGLAKARPILSSCQQSKQFSATRFCGGYS